MAGGTSGTLKNKSNNTKVIENNADERAEVKSTAVESQNTIKEKRKTGPTNASGGRVKKGGVLRYPYQALTKNTDYLQIDIIEYKSIKQSSGSLISNPSSGNRRLTSAAAIGGTRPRGLSKSALVNAGSILLPVPNSVQDGNSVDYGNSKMNSLQAVAANGVREIMDAPATGGDPDKTYMNNMAAAVDKFTGDLQAGVGTGDKATDLLKKRLTTSALGLFGGNITVEQLMSRENGEIFNPNLELLFNGPTLRAFKFSWKMMPRNQKEAEQCKLIILAFKQNMAPKTKASPGQGGSWFLKTPNVFELRYRTGNKDHPFLHKFKQCFLTDIAVNYTGEASHMTYGDGTPVSMQMDLTFKELEPIYDVDYDDVEGVGY